MDTQQLDLVKTKIDALLKAGDQLWNQGESSPAMERWLRALELVEQLVKTYIDDIADTYCHLLLRVGRLYMVRGQIDKALESFQLLANCAQESGQAAWQALSQAWLSRVACHNNDLGLAESLAEQGQRLAEALPSGVVKQRALALNYHELGMVTVLRGDYHRALAVFRKAQALFQQASDLSGEALCLFAIGRLYVFMSFPGQAMVQYEAAAKLYEKVVGDPTDRFYHQLGWGVACRMLESYAEALEHYRVALDIARALDSPSSQARCLNNIAVIRFHQGEYDGALALYQQVLDLFRHLGDRQSIAPMLVNIGGIHIAQGNGQRALDMLNLAKQLAEDIDFRPVLPEIYALSSAACLLIEQPSMAFDHAEESLRLSESASNMQYAAIAYRALGAAAAKLEEQGRLPPVVPVGGPRVYFSASLEILERSEQVYERACSLQALGKYLCASSNPVKQAEGEACLTQAAEYFERIGIPMSAW